MRLKNKRTGEIGYLYEHSLTQDIIIVYDVKGIVGKYTSLAELNSEWEDAPEPKGYWYIEGDGDIHHIGTELCDELEIHTMKQIGNYFETKEEAEKAVERLRAWKRLKDKGFRFQGWEDLEAIELPIKHYNNIVGFRLEDNHDVVVDLNTIFGGEE